MRKYLFLALFLIPSQTAAQPYSDSMADCAALYQNAAQWAPDHLVDTLMYGAGQWHAAAVAQSTREGSAMSPGAMWDKVDTQTEVWEQKGATFLMSEEFREWSAYCKSFAKKMNVAYKLSTD